MGVFSGDYGTIYQVSYTEHQWLKFILSLLHSVPQITEEPDSLENVTPGKPAEFVVKAVGKNLTYTWHRQTAEQLLPSEKRVIVGNTQILHIDEVESSDEGYYICTISNPTGGSVETKPARLTTSMFCMFCKGNRVRADDSSHLIPRPH